MSPILEARDIHVRLGGRNILDGINLSFDAGQVVALVGPNGAGKTTLLGTLTGDIEPTRGDVLLEGLELANWPLLDAARMRAVQTQQARVSFAFTAAEVVQMGRAPWRGTEYEDDDEVVVATAMAMTETVGMAQQRVTTMSGGEVARTSFARALAQEAAVLLLDEPTAALDIRHQELLLEQARERALLGATVIVVLHDLSLAGAFADRIVVIDAGHVVADGTPEEVLRAELLSEVYRHPVRVIPDPETGTPVVLPVRSSRVAASFPTPVLTGAES